MQTQQLLIKTQVSYITSKSEDKMLVIMVAVLCVVVIYRYTTRNHDYWEKRNVKHDPPLPFFGNHFKNLLIKRSLVETCAEMLDKFKGEKIVGYYRGRIPELIIKDPEIIKHVLTVDSKNFPNKWFSDNIKDDPLLHNILFLGEDNRSRLMRQQVSGGFTPSKLRNMSPRVLACTERLQQVMAKVTSQGDTVATLPMMVDFTLQCVGACGFGVHLDAICDWPLLKDLMIKFFIHPQPIQILSELSELLPQIQVLFGHVKFVDNNLEKNIIEITKTIRDDRKCTSGGVKDFMDIAIEMAANRKDDNLSEAEAEKANLRFTAAQLFLFLFAGFETTATNMSATLHQLAYHPETQQHIQKEIDTVLAEHNNRLMDSLNKMTLLDMAIKESLRMFSPVGVLRRVCVDEYTLPGTDVTIDRGVRILIPVQAIHKDPDIYEHPEEFRPERFASYEEKADFKYMVFGEGPKKCLGNRLAAMMVSAGLATILRGYTVVPAPESERLLQAKKTSFLVQLLNGDVPLKFIPRDI